MKHDPNVGPRPGTDDLVDRFVTGRLDEELFGHIQHVEVCWAMLRRWGPETGGRLFREALKRSLVLWHAESKYSETITSRWLDLVGQALRETPDLGTFDEFLRHHPHLSGRARKAQDPIPIGGSHG